MEIIEKDNKKGPSLGVRHLQAMLLFLNITIVFINRIHVGVTIVAMTNSENSNPEFPEYDWNEKEKSWILSSFYWGYVLTHLPGGYFVRRFGAKINLLTYTLACGVLSCLTPLCVPVGGWRIFCLLRFAMGFSQGGVYPAMQQHLANWVPPSERSLLSGFSNTGFDCGILMAMGLSGIIAVSSLGWPGMFYIAGALCMIWCVLWQLFGANDINDSKYVTDKERLYIEETLKGSIDFQKKQTPVPWRAVFTSAPFYALVIVRSAIEFGFFTIQNEWPSYINAVLKMNIRDNALFSALPALASWLFVYIFMFIAEMVAKHTSLSLTTSRKCFNSFGIWLPAAGMILVGYLNEEHKVFAVLLMAFLLAMHSSVTMGCMLIHIDMAPNHTSIIISIVNMIANLTLMLGPLYVGVIVNDEQNRSQWQMVFITFAIVFCVGDMVFLIWGSAQEQPWNAPDFLEGKGEQSLSGRDENKTEAQTNVSTSRGSYANSNTKFQQDNAFLNTAFDKTE